MDSALDFDFDSYADLHWHYVLCILGHRPLSSSPHKKCPYPDSVDTFGIKKRELKGATDESKNFAKIRSAKITAAQIRLSTRDAADVRVMTSTFTTHHGNRAKGSVNSGETEVTRFYLHDVLGNVIALVNIPDEEGTPQVTQVYQYDGFGNPLILSQTWEMWNGALTVTDEVPNPYRWNGASGYYWDEDTGLYLMGLRWYDSTTGRFLTRDPIGFGGGDANLYRYVGNNPLNEVDPFGTWPPKWVKEYGGLFKEGCTAFTSLVYLQKINASEEEIKDVLDLPAEWVLNRGALRGGYVEVGKGNVSGGVSWTVDSGKEKYVNVTLVGGSRRTRDPKTGQFQSTYLQFDMQYSIADDGEENLSFGPTAGTSQNGKKRKGGGEVGWNIFEPQQVNLGLPVGPVTGGIIVDTSKLGSTFLDAFKVLIGQTPSEK
jgi:RHS repeat-associated protein